MGRFLLWWLFSYLLPGYDLGSGDLLSIAHIPAGRTVQIIVFKDIFFKVS